MSVEQNVSLMRRWFQEVWNEGKLQTIHDLMAAEAGRVEKERFTCEKRSSCLWSV